MIDSGITGVLSYPDIEVDSGVGTIVPEHEIITHS